MTGRSNFFHFEKAERNIFGFETAERNFFENGKSGSLNRKGDRAQYVHLPRNFQLFQVGRARPDRATFCNIEKVERNIFGDAKEERNIFECCGSAGYGRARYGLGAARWVPEGQYDGAAQQRRGA